MENTWEYPAGSFNDEEELCQRVADMKKPGYSRKNTFKSSAAGRCLCNLVERNNQTHRCHHTLENTFPETSSSSNSSTSSSTSSSDSEEEFSSCGMKKPFNTSRKNQLTTEEGRKFFSLVELEGLRPQEVTAEVNLKCRILLIKLKTGASQCKQQQVETPLSEKKLVRVVALPSNILLEKLQVQVVLRANCLIVEAPFTARHSAEQSWKQQARFLPAWLPVRVTVKNSVHLDILRTAQQQHFLPHMKDFPNEWISFDRFKRYWKQQQQQFRGEDATGSYGPFHQQQPEFSTANKKWKKQQQLPLNIPTQSSTLLPSSEIIFDPILNKPVMLLKINVAGFRVEEVQVRVEETQRVLIVEAVKKSQQLPEEEEMMEQQQQGLTTKFLRREFFLPRFLDLEHVEFRVLKSGIVVVKLAIVKQHLKSMSSNCFTCRVPETGCGCSDELKKDTLLSYNKMSLHTQSAADDCWEKPLRA